MLRVNILSAWNKSPLSHRLFFSSVQRKQYFAFPLALCHLAGSLHTSRQMLSSSVRKPSAIATIPSLSLLQAESRKSGMVRLLISNRVIAEGSNTGRGRKRQSAWFDTRTGNFLSGAARDAKLIRQRRAKRRKGNDAQDAKSDDPPDGSEDIAPKDRKPYPNFGSPMTQIREEKQISVGELSCISGLSEAVLEAAEGGTVEMTDADSREVRKAYWALSALEATPADYRRLVAEMAMKARGD